MKKRSMVLAALAPLIAISGANAATDEAEAPEMRIWSAVLSEPSEEAAGAALKIVASQAAGGSNRMVVESVAIVSTEVSEDDEGNMTETMSSLECAGPFMVEGGGFMVEAAAPMEEEGEMAEAKEEMEEGEEMAEAGEAEDAGCAFAVTGEVKHTYRAWHSWDMAGSVTVGEVSMDFSIADSAAAMILEPEPEEEMEMEMEMSEEATEES